MRSTATLECGALVFLAFLFAPAPVLADHFKRINDTWGHGTGDEASIAMACALQAHATQGGFTVRFGGEEFVWIQEVNAGQEPDQCLESLRAAIEAIELHAPNGERVPLTVSIGATLNPAESIDEMLSTADQAVYLAKEGGRNRVVVLDAPVSGKGNSTQIRIGKRSG